MSHAYPHHPPPPQKKKIIIITTTGTSDRLKTLQAKKKGPGYLNLRLLHSRQSSDESCISSPPRPTPPPSKKQQQEHWEGSKSWALQFDFSRTFLQSIGSKWKPSRNECRLTFLRVHSLCACDPNMSRLVLHFCTPLRWLILMKDKISKRHQTSKQR